MGYAYLVKGIKVSRQDALRITEQLVDISVERTRHQPLYFLKPSSENYQIADTFNNLVSVRQPQLIDLNDGSFVLGLVANGGKTPEEGTDLIDVRKLDFVTAGEFFHILAEMGIAHLLSGKSAFGSYIAVSS